MKKEEPILVVISCMVYNHEPYIRDCLEGFVMQKTNFRFIAVVHDDCSTDKTADIIREYEAKYPDIVKPIYETENQWSKHDGSLDRILGKALDATGAKYLATCEGDDYWTDPLKLQKQVDFLENHPDYSLCFHDVKVFNQVTQQYEENTITRDVPGTSDITELAKGNYIHTPSVMVRKNENVVKRFKDMGTVMPSDYVLWMLYAETGKIYKLPEKMAVYRLGSGVWSGVKGIGNDLSMLITLTKLWGALPQVRAELWKQICKFKQYMQNEDDKKTKQFEQMSNSKAYRLGKCLLKPFKWMRRKG